MDLGLHWEEESLYLCECEIDVCMCVCAYTRVCACTCTHALRRGREWKKYSEREMLI